MEPPGGTPYLIYKEDIFKTNQGGLKQCKLIPKEVVHHDDPSRCLMRLYKLYNSLCPSHCPDNAFYIPGWLAKPKQDCWFKASAMGHGKLAEVVPRLMKSAGIKGYFTNHSLRVTAIRLECTMLRLTRQNRALLCRWSTSIQEDK